MHNHDLHPNKHLDANGKFCVEIHKICRWNHSYKSLSGQFKSILVIGNEFRSGRSLTADTGWLSDMNFGHLLNASFHTMLPNYPKMLSTYDACCSINERASERKRERERERITGPSREYRGAMEQKQIRICQSLCVCVCVRKTWLYNPASSSRAAYARLGAV